MWVGFKRTLDALRSNEGVDRCSKKDFSLASKAGQCPGIFKMVKSYLHHHRVGDILVLNGKISPSQLGQIMREERENICSRTGLGTVLVERGIITAQELKFALFKQKLIRSTIAFCAVFISLSGGTIKTAKAGGLKDVPSKIKLVNAKSSAKKESFGAYPALFGYNEKRSTELKAFTKWSGMFDRFENEIRNGKGSKEIQKLQKDLARLTDLSLEEKVKRVNDLMNKVQYITDSKNWGQTDYWATPVEFLIRGGDCEDFAIAKYTALRMIGVPEERMRLAIVQDTYKNIPHAVLIVYTDNGPMLLDNQIKEAISTNATRRYQPIYSINRTAWWLHKGQGMTRVASLN